MTTISLTIAGVPYDLTKSVQDASLGDLLDVEEATQGDDGTSGVSMLTINQMFTRIDEILSREDTGSIDLLSDPFILKNLAGSVFLAKRYAGEEITFAEARDVPAKSVRIAIEVDSDPKDE
jgi:hypothetical protein